MIPPVQYDAHDGNLRTSFKDFCLSYIFFSKKILILIETTNFGVLSKFIFGIKHCGNWHGKVQTQIRTYPNIFST